MAIESSGYWYSENLKRYITQFMAVFSGLQVKIGKGEIADKESLIPVTIHYGSHDRQVAALMADNTQNKPIRLPMMTAYMTNLTLATHLMKGTGQERRQSYVPTGGLLPDDVEVVHQRMPLPYLMDVELGIYASNTDQHFQILEQLLMLFDPQITIQTSDSPFDWARMTTIKLVDMNIDQQYPVGTDRRIIQSSLRFEMVVYLGAPAEVRKDFIKRINMRIGLVNHAIDSGNVVEELDNLGIDYYTIADAADLGFE